MVKKARISSKPPIPTSADAFIDAAEESPQSLTESTGEEKLPWEESTVREDVIKSVNLRLSEPYILKLQYLSEKTNKSQQRLIREVLCPAIDKEIERIFST